MSCSRGIPRPAVVRPIVIPRMLAAGAAGNVWAAMADLDLPLGFEDVEEPVVAPAGKWGLACYSTIGILI